MYKSVSGAGPDLVLLHGWSMHSAVWHDMADALADNFTLHLVDLPGHGQSGWQAGDFDIGHLLTQLANQLPQTAYWLGGLRTAPLPSPGDLLPECRVFRLL